MVVATGLSAPHIPDVPGMELVTETYENVSLDPGTYEGQRILVLGKGNAAFGIADVMRDGAAPVHVASPNPVPLGCASTARSRMAKSMTSSSDGRRRRPQPAGATPGPWEACLYP